MFIPRLSTFCSLLCCLVYSPAVFYQAVPDSLGQPGVSFALARQRAALVKDIQYELAFHLPAEKDQPVNGEEKITYRLDALPQNGLPLLLDFKAPPSALRSLEINGQPATLVFEKEHIQLPGALLHPGVNTVTLVFTSGNAALNRNTEFLYTLLVPDRARTIFPCWDQPDLKAEFSLSLTLPADWKAIANASLQDSERVGDDLHLHFRRSNRMSTYLFSFAAGKFSDSTRLVNGGPMSFLYRETDSTKLRLSLDSVFRIEAQSLTFLEGYTKLKYPFQKFGFVAIPDFQFGGMEHVGAIQYKASTLFLDSGATREQLISRSNLLAHETAHMWFGDLVTMTWFNDVWMKEVFANFMADKISSVTLPDGNYDLKFLTDHYSAAYSIDRTAGAHPIRQTLSNLQEAGSLYGNIIYHKAPIVMRQLERLMGAEAFQKGLQAYLARYANGNASWPDLIRELQPFTTIDLTAWNKVWVNEAGRPVFSYKLKTTKDRISDLLLTQRGEDGSARIWPQLFELALVYKDHIEQLTVKMSAAGVHVPEAVGKERPLSILFNSSGQGYGVFPVDRAGLPLPVSATPLMRAAVYINLYENMLNGRGLNPRELLTFDRRLLAGEPEELDLNIVLDQLLSIYWRYLPVNARDSLAAGLEKDCWNAMHAVTSDNEKKLLFRAYTNIAVTRTALDTMFAIWQTRQPPAGVKLSEDDYTGLAAALALRDYPGSPGILQEQLARIQNKDRRLRLEYLLPSLSADIHVRDSFFFSLEKPEARRKEAWVLTALGYLHHPLRTAASEKYLQPSLDWLADIQRTGDVFFPQSWLQATFSWYQTKSAAAVVRSFLREHPDYNPKLKAKILQATDNLFRASK
jgi:aminopeptidase N